MCRVLKSLFQCVFCFGIKRLQKQVCSRRRIEELKLLITVQQCMYNFLEMRSSCTCRVGDF